MAVEASPGLKKAIVDRVRDAASNAGPTPGNVKLHQVQDSMERLSQWSGEDYEGEVPTTGPSPLTVVPTAQEDPADTVEEIRDLVDAGDDWTNTQQSDGLVTFAEVEAARARGEQWALDVVWTAEEIAENS